MTKRKTKGRPDPTQICARMNKGWAFMGNMTVEQYRQAEAVIEHDLEVLRPEQFEAKYQTWMY
jgi:hypothetical protein